MWVKDFVDCIEGSTLDQPRFEQALSIKEQHLPRRIYKYRRDCSNSRRNLETDTVWLSSPDSYNDPYDCWFRFSEGDLLVELERTLVDKLVTQNKLQAVVAEGQIENARRSHNPLKVITGHIPDSISGAGDLRQRVELSSEQAYELVKATSSKIQQWRKQTKLCSFSAIKDSLLMWGHYADNHRGFCLEYDLESLRPDHPLCEKLYPVIYTNNIYDLTPWALTLVSAHRGGFNPELPILSVIHKCDEWKYEQEWRMVRVTPEVESDQDWQVPTPSRIFLRSEMELAKVKELREICSKRKIEVWQMRLAEDRFELMPARLD
jgi:Protein of unknown function (DUF2971)